MQEGDFGSRDRRGHFKPRKPLEIAPFYRRPFQAKAVLNWLPYYFLPWNLLFALSALAWWLWIVPPVEVMQTLSAGWPLRLLLVNAVAVFLYYSAFELRLYVQRAQGTRYKYNPAFPADRRSRTFLFGRQNLDNMLRTMVSGVPIWTGLQVLALWAFANGFAPWLSWAQHPVYLTCLALLVPMIHQLHFYCIHRLIHTEWLYRRVHSIHHKATNPSPWSSLAMHPVEQLLYFASVLYHVIIPSHPVIALYQLHYAGFGAVPGHIGFDRVEVGGKPMDAHAYGHYLHHKFFEVNYGDGSVPLDWLFGTFHDGSEEADAKMRARLAKKARTRKALEV